MPAEAARLLPAAVVDAEASLQPIAAEELLVLLGRTAKVWKLPDDWDETAEFYVEALEDLPADLVHSALKHCRLTLKWFPKPSEVREPVVQELRRRRDVLRRLKLMEQKARLGDVAPPELRAVKTPEEIAAGEERAAQARAILDSVSLKRIPGRKEDLEEHRPVSVADAYKATKLKPGAWLDKPAKAEGAS